MTLKPSVCLFKFAEKVELPLRIKYSLKTCPSYIRLGVKLLVAFFSLQSGIFP